MWVALILFIGAISCYGIAKDEVNKDVDNAIVVTIFGLLFAISAIIIMIGVISSC